jgi:hypothetical protein
MTKLVDIVKSYRSDNLTYVYSSLYSGKDNLLHILRCAGDRFAHMLFANTFNQELGCRHKIVVLAGSKIRRELNAEETNGEAVMKLATDFS